MRIYFGHPVNNWMAIAPYGKQAFQEKRRKCSEGEPVVEFYKENIPRENTSQLLV